MLWYSSCLNTIKGSLNLQLWDCTLGRVIRGCTPECTLWIEMCSDRAQMTSSYWWVHRISSGIYRKAGRWSHPQDHHHDKSKPVPCDTLNKHTAAHYSVILSGNMEYKEASYNQHCMVKEAKRLYGVRIRSQFEMPDLHPGPLWAASQNWQITWMLSMHVSTQTSLTSLLHEKIPTSLLHSLMRGQWLLQFQTTD